MAFGAQILWDTTAENSTLVFSVKNNEAIHTVTVIDDSFELNLDSEYLKGIDNQTEITVEVRL